MPSSPAWKACATPVARRARDDRPGAHRRARSSPSSTTPSPSRTTKSSSSTEWQWRGEERWPGADRHVRQAAAPRAGGAAEVAAHALRRGPRCAARPRRRRARRSCPAAARPAAARPPAARRRTGAACPAAASARRPRRRPRAAAASARSASRCANASTSSGSSVARERACAPPRTARWTMTSPARTSCSASSCQLKPAPASTKKISSSSAWTCSGIGRQPGAIR